MYPNGFFEDYPLTRVGETLVYDAISVPLEGCGTDTVIAEITYPCLESSSSSSQSSASVTPQTGCCPFVPGDVISVELTGKSGGCDCADPVICTINVTSGMIAANYYTGTFDCPTTDIHIALQCEGDYTWNLIDTDLNEVVATFEVLTTGCTISLAGVGGYTFDCGTWNTITVNFPDHCCECPAFGSTFDPDAYDIQFSADGPGTPCDCSIPGGVGLLPQIAVHSWSVAIFDPCDTHGGSEEYLQLSCSAGIWVLSCPFTYGTGGPTEVYPSAVSDSPFELQFYVPTSWYCDGAWDGNYVLWTLIPQV